METDIREPWVGRTKFNLPVDDKSHMSEFFQKRDDLVEMTVHCTLPHKNGKPWSFTGPQKKALAAQKAHKRNHRKRLG